MQKHYKGITFLWLFFLQLTALEAVAQEGAAYTITINFSFVQRPKYECADFEPEFTIGEVELASGEKIPVRINITHTEATLNVNSLPIGFVYSMKTCEKKNGCSLCIARTKWWIDNAFESVDISEEKTAETIQISLGGEQVDPRHGLQVGHHNPTVVDVHFGLEVCNKVGLGEVSIAGSDLIDLGAQETYEFTYGSIPNGLEITGYQWQLNGENLGAVVTDSRTKEVDFSGYEPGSYILRCIPQFAATDDPCLDTNPPPYTKEIVVLPSCVDDESFLLAKGTGIIPLGNREYRVLEGSNNESVPVTVKLDGATDADDNYAWNSASFSSGNGISISPDFSETTFHQGSQNFTVTLREMQKYPAQAFSYYTDEQYGCPDPLPIKLFYKGQDRYLVQVCPVTLPNDIVPLLANEADMQDKSLEEMDELVGKGGVLSSFSWTIESQTSIVIKPGMKLVDGAKLIIKRDQQAPDGGADGEDLNYNFTRHITYDEQGNRIGESKQYFDHMGKLLQAQEKNYAGGVVLATQPVYDTYGRAAISTLPAPVQAETSGKESLSSLCPDFTIPVGEDLQFGYKKNFMTNAAGKPFSYKDFDNGNESSPNAIANTEPGTLGWYYSNNNTAGSHEQFAEAYVPATAYPYARTVFNNDGTGEAKGTAGPGEALSMASGRMATTEKTSLEAGELNDYLRMRAAALGLEEKDNKLHKAYKVVSKDIHGVESVAYFDGGGQQLAGKYDGTFVNFSFYDDAGRLKASITPNGIHQFLNESVGYALIDKTTYTYDFEGKLLQTTEPDAGTTHYMYRRDGLLRFSQNSKQADEGKGNFSYINYDRLGRPIESGEFVPSGSLLFESEELRKLLENKELADGLTEAKGSKRDQLFSYYDLPDRPRSEVSRGFYAETGLSQDNYKQTFLRGAVSYTENNHVKTWYSYDDRGRVKWMVQHLKDMPADNVKTLDYSYGPAGNVRLIAYQKGKADQFYHYYTYDASQRLKEVFTAREEVNLIIDTEGENPSYDYTIDDESRLSLQASYQYYLHGPLKRVVLADKLQGIDYVYTVQGWLKAINHPLTERDPGKDGANGFAKDMFGMTLEYFSGDYSKEGTDIESLQPANQQYQGNIAAMSWRTGSTEEVVAYQYSYDRRSQLTTAEWLLPDMASHSLGSAVESEQFKVGGIGYDGNGNIQSLQRRNQTGALWHNLEYKYAYEFDGVKQAYNNRLLEVPGYSSYEYNAIGQLKAEMPQGQEELPAEEQRPVQYMVYDVTGKLTHIYADKEHLSLLFSYRYDDRGFRLMKQDHVNNKQTWYVRDNSGQLLSIYVQEPGGSLQQEELPVYGSGRLGNYYAADGSYRYELKDHLGNVRAVLEREKPGTELASMGHYADYYPFGLKLPGRHMPGSRYGYQGEFSEDETEESGWNFFELRQYDPVVGRFITVDPERQFASAYLGMGNNPVNGVDPDGGFFGLENDIHINGDGKVVRVDQTTENLDRVFLDGTEIFKTPEGTHFNFDIFTLINIGKGIDLPSLSGIGIGLTGLTLESLDKMVMISSKGLVRPKSYRGRGWNMMKSPLPKSVKMLSYGGLALDLVLAGPTIYNAGEAWSKGNFNSAETGALLHTGGMIGLSYYIPGIGVAVGALSLYAHTPQGIRIINQTLHEKAVKAYDQSGRVKLPSGPTYIGPGKW